MSVHYKFKSVSKKWGTITFDSAVISLNDLKKAIVAQEKTDPNNRDFDFIITNAQTRERYTNDNYLIPKNTSVEVRRVPATHSSSVRIKQTPDVVKSNKNAKQLAPLASTDEQRNAIKVSSSATPSVAASRPNEITCRRCQQTGHLESNCRPEMRSPPSLPTIVQTDATGVPPKFMCKLCRNLYTNPCVTPCCFTTYCSPCIRQALLADSHLGCPFCKQTGIEPDSLKPNLGISKKVAEFLKSRRSESQPFDSIGKKRIRAEADISDIQCTKEKSLKLNSNHAVPVVTR